MKKYMFLVLASVSLIGNVSAMSRDEGEYGASHRESHFRYDSRSEKPGGAVLSPWASLGGAAAGGIIDLTCGTFPKFTFAGLGGMTAGYATSTLYRNADDSEVSAAGQSEEGRDRNAKLLGLAVGAAVFGAILKLAGN